MRSDRVRKGIDRAPHRSLLKATGNYTDSDEGKPMIAIVSSHIDVIPGHAHLDVVSQFVKQAVREAGGVPFIFNTIGVDDGIAMGHGGMKYSLPSRELIADTVETMIHAHCFDGMICIPNCDKIIPGMLMAAGRCNIPSIFVSGGPMEAGRTSTGRKVDLIDAFAGVAAVTSGKMSEDELADIENHACPTCGSCSGLFTANSMNCLCEVLGMALPGNGTILATSDDRRELYRAAARRIVELVKEDLKPRDILTAGAFDNAMVLDMAMGGSTNTVLHLPAVAHDAGITFDLERINELSKRTPTLCKIAPSPGKDGKLYHIEDLQAAGGIMTLLGELVRAGSGLLDESCMTVTGKNLGQTIAANDIRLKDQAVQRFGLESSGQVGSETERDAALRRTIAEGGRSHDGPPVLNAIEEGTFDPFDCIRTAETAYSPEGGLTILFGNLAPEGAVVKTAGVDPKMLVHSGPAVIFECQEDACEGILGGKVKAGDVVIIRYEGPKGGPGMQEMLAPTSYIKGAGLGDKCALITDGRFSGGTSGACIGHVSPEAAGGGAIGLIRDGDIIEIDILGRTLNVKVDEAELEGRRGSAKAPERALTGWLKRYASMVTSATTGAVLKS